MSATGYPMLLTEMTHPDRAAHRRDLGDGRQVPRAEGRRHDGDHRQRRAVRVPGPRASRRSAASTELRLYDIDPAATAKCAAQPRRTRASTITACATPEEAVVGAADHHHRHRRQAVRDDPDRQHGRRRRAHQRASAATAPARPNCTATSCCAPTSSSNTRRRPASRARSSSSTADHPVTELWQVIAGPAPKAAATPRRSRCSTRVGFAIEDFSALRYVRGQAGTRPACSPSST